jgi:DNA-binding Lrp family transcriptional regulator
VTDLGTNHQRDDVKQQGASDLDDLDLTLLRLLEDEGKSHAEAAADAGCSTKTIQRRSKRSAFRQARRELRNERLVQLGAQLGATAADAVSVLHAELADADRSADRVRAASLLINLHLRVHDEQHIADELQALRDEVEALRVLMGGDGDEAPES